MIDHEKYKMRRRALALDMIGWVLLFAAACAFTYCGMDSALR